MIPFIKCINKNNRDAPLLTYAYGAFNWSNLPYFDPRVAELWLKRGGNYVLAWPRGGGELGLQWHKAAVKLNKHKTEEDLVAILKKLKATYPMSKQGIMGASAGGWLVSLTSAKHPDLIDATLVQVPVTDIGNLHQYTSKAFNQDSEFGDTSLGNKAYYQTITPMTYIKSDVKLPATYVLGVREDLRAPVIHSRKLVEAYQSQGQNIHYYEETKGGHSSNLNNHFNAIERAYYFTFLWHYLD